MQRESSRVERFEAAMLASIRRAEKRLKEAEGTVRPGCLGNVQMTPCQARPTVCSPLETSPARQLPVQHSAVEGS